MFKLNYTIDRNIPYKNIDGVTLVTDIFRPKKTGLKPAVVVVHGGGWRSRSGSMEYLCRKLANQGFVAFNVRYRLAPEYRYPSATQDIEDAIKWVQKNSKTYGVDASQVFGWGYSAGAHLILQVGLDQNLNLKGIVAGGTPADLTAWPKSPLVTPFLGHTYSSKPELWREASPVNRVSPKSPPVFLYHGQRDPLVEVEQMHKMVEALNKKNVRVETYTAKWLGHISMYVFSSEAYRRGIRFLRNSSLKTT